ncbi:MAG: hypothetical protein V4726_08670 [Verrucomicrobiota bacterium]
MSSRPQGTLTVLVVVTMLGCFLLSGLLLRQGSAEPPRTPVSRAQVIPAGLRPKPGGGGQPVFKKVAPQKPVAVFGHSNGWRTETRKTEDSSRVRQDTYNKDNVLAEVRIFKVDGEGRLKNGVIYDGRQNPVGSTRYSYDPHSNQLLMEELYNKNGILARKLYYPGALKDPEFAKRMVAFSFDPQKRNPREVEIEGPVQPIVPVSGNGGEFIPEAGAGRAPIPSAAGKTVPRSRVRASEAREFQSSSLRQWLVLFKKKS